MLGGTALRFPDGEVGSVTCAEDGSVVVWKGTEMLQSLLHPCCVWDVCVVSRGNGEAPDIVTAGHDGSIRVFSCDHSLASSAVAVVVQDNFQQEVEAALRARRRGPSGEEIAKYPAWEDRAAMAGSSEGQVGRASFW